MSLEQALKENTEAVLKLAALIESAKLTNVAADQAEAAPATKEEKEDKPAPRRRGRQAKAEAAEVETKPASKYTAEQVKAAAVKVKDKFGSEAAKKLISDHGAPKLDQLKPEVYEDFINAAEAMINGDDDEGDEDDDL